MKKKKNFTVVFAFATVLIGIIILTVIVGLNMTDKQETIQGQAETTDYRISSKVPARVLEIRVKEHS